MPDQDLMSSRRYFFMRYSLFHSYFLTPSLYVPNHKPTHSFDSHLPEIKVLALGVFVTSYNFLLTNLACVSGNNMYYSWIQKHNSINNINVDFH